MSEWMLSPTQGIVVFLMGCYVGAAIRDRLHTGRWRFVDAYALTMLGAAFWFGR